jgi:hypothetical protein
MFIIHRITALYDAQQDRIVLAVADKQSNTRKLCMTRRLTQRLVPALLDGLQDQINAPADVQPEMLAAANVYAQLQARINKKPTKAVQTDIDTPQYLVQEMAVKVGKKGATNLEFRSAEMPDSATLTLRASELRQWLEALKRAAEQGDWKLDVFPQWLLARAKT